MNQKRLRQNQWKKKAKAVGVFLLIGLLTAFIANLFLQWSQNDLNVNLAFKFAFQWHTEMFLLGTGVLFVLYVWFVSLIGNKWGGAVLLALTALILGIATHQKMMHRGEPLYPIDLEMAAEIPFLIEMVGLPLAVALGIFLVASIVGIGILLYRQSKNQPRLFEKRTRYIVRAIGFFVSSSCLVYIGSFNEPGNKLKAAYDPHAYWIPYSQDMNYYNNGFIGGFLYNLQTKPMEEPSGYSRTRMEELAEKYRSISENLNEERSGKLAETNVVFVMNESFADPLRLEGFSSNKDPIPYFRQLSKETMSGMALAQGYGGGTANSEFEALTSLSIEPLAPNISSPYTQMADKMADFPSVAKRLKKSAHRATAIHPYNTTMYKRQDVYQSLGFDQFLYDETMRHKGKLDSNPYISDQEAYKEVLSVMEESEEKDFIHLVTMQNHMPYGTKYPDTTFRSRGSGNPSEADGYLQDLAYSDEALRFLIEELNRFEEPVVLVFWGDHLPSFYGEGLTQRNSSVVLHQTPVLFYSNQTKLEGNVGTISPIFFVNHVLEALKMSVTPYDALLYHLEKELPAFKKGTYLERGNAKPKELRAELSTAASILLEEYHLLQYDLTAGKQYAKEVGFFSK